MALYAYIEDDISVQPVSRYFDVNRNNGSKKNVDAMYDEVAKVFNNADHILLRSGKTAVLKLRIFQETKNIGWKILCSLCLTLQNSQI